jgi:hypothetical protein
MAADWGVALGGRWVVERTFAWLYRLLRLRVGYEKRAGIRKAFRLPSCILIRWSFSAHENLGWELHEHQLVSLP